ncbi:MAG TPA: hypothetical protein VHG28_22140 [Longimicrobiaceae bacterium]|nr:hypothetical protein [Longimicrobiaceae bacterium]
MTTHHHDGERPDLKGAFLGLGIALVWLLIVGGISYFWALS